MKSNVPTTVASVIPVTAKLACADTKTELGTAFTSSLEVPTETEPHLGEALRHTLEHPGSLVRARLVYEMSQVYGLSDIRSKSLAVAIEYFHTASLLFDDLPCMDDAMERRGEPCVHRIQGEAATVLAALGLVSRAYALLWQGLVGLPTDRQSLAGAYVEKCLGVDGLLNGQSEDLHFASLPKYRRSPHKVATGKTVSLIRLSLVLPALLGGAQPGEVQLLERLAAFWGLSYQILDDLKDVFQQPGQTGKTAARDKSLNRPNIALAIGTNESLLRLERLLVLGDQVLARLVARLPTLVYLTELRSRFQEEMVGIKATNPSLAQ
jgi:geranylgeranyl diphosphate synthase, type II